MMIAPIARLDVDAAVKDPAEHFGSPVDVVRDPRLTQSDKRRILQSWVRDAEQLSQAEDENMPGPERPRLQEAKLALLELEGVPMPSTIRTVTYAYVTAASKPSEAARILEALRAANVNLLAFSGFPQARGKAQIDLVTDDIDGLKAVAKREKWKLSRIKRAFLVQGTDEVGAAIAPLAKVGASNINVIAADAIAAGEGRFGMIFWVAQRDYNRAAKLLQATSPAGATTTPG